MTNEEYVNFFDDMKPAPDNAYEYHVCSNCMMALANDDYTGMDDTEAKATEEGLAVLHGTYQMVIPDGTDYGFEHAKCECCDGLAGDRFRVLCFDKKEAE